MRYNSEAMNDKACVRHEARTKTEISHCVGLGPTTNVFMNERLMLLVEADSWAAT